MDFINALCDAFNEIFCREVLLFVGWCSSRRRCVELSVQEERFHRFVGGLSSL